MNGDNEKDRFRLRISMRELLLLATIAVLGVAQWSTYRRLQHRESELGDLRATTGYLRPSEAGQIAAVRAPSDQPLTYRVRVRVPESPRFRVAYSSLWEKDAASPEWFAAVDLPPGESVVIVRILKDPRDDRWKITTLVQSERGTKRLATVLPDEHAEVFRQSRDAISAGVGKETVAVAKTESIRLLDEKWLVGEAGMLLYGNKSPATDQIGIYAELQPDIGPL